MYSEALLLVAAVFTQEVCCSYYQGPVAHPVVLKSGFLADTHEVAAAKGAHLAVLGTQSHGYGGSEHSGSYGGQGDHRYHGPIAIPHVLHDGHIADTHEVAAAKAAHFSAVARARSHGGYGSGHGGYSGEYAAAYQGYSGHAVPYHGPLAQPVVLKSGYLADTHDVSAAKHHHLEALHEAGQHGHYDNHY